MVIWYNKDIFDENNVPYPPSDPKEWTWDLFLETAIQLTTDRNGKHPNEEGFDPQKIETYGAEVSNWFADILPIIWSNGGDIADETGTKPLIGEKEAIEAVQLIADLIHVHHVTPTPLSSSWSSCFLYCFTNKEICNGDRWSMGTIRFG